MLSLVSPSDFPASRTTTYLNTASVALMYRGAEAAANDWMRDLAARGTIVFDEEAEARVFDELHHSAARVFGSQPDDIAVGSNATELLASLAWALVPGRGENIVSTAVTFPTTIYPWARVARHTGCEVKLVEGHDDLVDPVVVIDAIDDRTAVVVISEVEYGTGQRYDVAQLAAAAHRRGALLVVDATQSAGAIPIDVTASGVDCLVASGYKWLCGPFGVAVMYIAPHLRDRLDPGIVGFRSHQDMWELDASRLEFPGAARRFEVSTMAYGCAIGLARSIDYLDAIGVDRIFERNAALADELIIGLRNSGAHVVSPEAGVARTSIVAARYPNVPAIELARRLKQAKIAVSARRNLLRFSPHLYNEPADIESALAEIEHYLAQRR